MESVHLEVKHKCSICDKDFSTKGSLNRHINDVHEANRTFKCPECPLKFARQDTLDRHVISAKANWKLHGVPLICACGKDFDFPKVRLLVDFYRQCLKFRTVLLSDGQVHLGFLNYCNMV